jgi:hypothetical protein
MMLNAAGAGRALDKRWQATYSETEFCSVSYVAIPARTIFVRRTSTAAGGPA